MCCTGAHRLPSAHFDASCHNTPGSGKVVSEVLRPMAKASKKLESLSFEEILTRLEDVVQKLEVGDAPLSEALATFETGVSLSRLGTQRLDEAERRIEMLLDDADDGTRTRPLMDKEPAFDE